MIWNEKIECASEDELKSLQSIRLAATVKRVYENVPLYRERMDKAGVSPEDIRSVEDLHKLPFTNKKDLNDSYPYGMFAVPMEQIVRIHASSGTTGKQTVAGYTRNDLDNWAEVCARTLTAAGVTSKDIFQISKGYGLFTGGLGLHYGAERIGAAVIPVSVGNTLRQLKIMREFKPTVISCTPSYALFLAETAEKEGIDKSEFSLRVGIHGAEPWTDEMRAQIEERLGFKPYDIYGLTEIIGPGVAYECEEQNGMHINEDNFIAEVIDPDTGEVLPEGSRGELVFSCINKEGLPMLRFRTHDIGELLRDKCPCGRTLLKMKKPMGRTDDMLIIRGVNVFPSQVESVLLRLGDVAPYYQIIVDREHHTDTFEVIVEKPTTYDSDIDRVKDEKMIQREMQSTLGISPKITIVGQGVIPRTETKAVHVIDKRKLIV